MLNGINHQVRINMLSHKMHSNNVFYSGIMFRAECSSAKKKLGFKDFVVPFLYGEGELFIFKNSL